MLIYKTVYYAPVSVYGDLAWLVLGDSDPVYIPV